MNPIFDKFLSLKNENKIGRMDYFLRMLAISVLIFLVIFLITLLGLPILWVAIITIIMNVMLLYPVYIISIKRHNDMGIVSKFRPIMIVAVQAYAILVKQFQMVLILLGILPIYTREDWAKFLVDYPVLWVLLIAIGIFRITGVVFALIAFFKKGKNTDNEKSL